MIGNTGNIWRGDTGHSWATAGAGVKRHDV